MKWFYSPSTGGFYSTKINGDSRPNDAKEIDEEHYRLLKQAKSQGKDIELSGDDLTVAKDPVTLDSQKAAKKRWVETQRSMHLKDPDATIEVGDVTFQMGPSNTTDLNEALTTFSAVGSVPEGYTWRDINNIDHPVDLELLKKMALARAAQKNAIWQRSFSLKDAVAAAASESILEQIEW